MQNKKIKKVLNSRGNNARKGAEIIVFFLFILSKVNWQPLPSSRNEDMKTRLEGNKLSHKSFLAGQRSRPDK